MRFIKFKLILHILLFAHCIKFFIDNIHLHCRFLWGVGTLPGVDNVAKYKNFTQYDKSGCVPATLEHNKIYYSTVFAYNNALNSKATNGTSDGGKCI